MNRKLLQTLAFATFFTTLASESLVAMSDERHQCMIACAQNHQKCENECEKITGGKPAYGSCMSKCADAQTSCFANCPK